MRIVRKDLVPPIQINNSGSYTCERIIATVDEYGDSVIFRHEVTKALSPSNRLDVLVDARHFGGKVQLTLLDRIGYSVSNGLKMFVFFLSSCGLCTSEILTVFLDCLELKNQKHPNNKNPDCFLPRAHLTMKTHDGS